MKKVLIVTEANESVASGHLFECLVLCTELKDAVLLVNHDIPDKLRDRLPENVCYYEKNIQEESEILIGIIRKEMVEVVLFNLREIKQDFILNLRICYNGKVVCIDEFGNRRLDADVIINPMIGNKYWNYLDSQGRVIKGHEYLILPSKLNEYNLQNKVIRENINTITVSMGGIDYYNSTLKIVDWLLMMQFSGVINIVLGAGYRYIDELNSCIKGIKNCKVVQDIDYLYDLFLESDLAFCAGGNTLHELAAIGTPTIIVPTMPHELENAIEFQNRGFGIACVLSKELDIGDLDDAYSLVKDYRKRDNMSISGKLIVDGLGYVRVSDVLESL